MEMNGLPCPPRGTPLSKGLNNSRSHCKLTFQIGRPDCIVPDPQNHSYSTSKSHLMTCSHRQRAQRYVVSASEFANRPVGGNKDEFGQFYVRGACRVVFPNTILASNVNKRNCVCSNIISIWTRRVVIPLTPGSILTSFPILP